MNVTPLTHGIALFPLIFMALLALALIIGLIMLIRNSRNSSPAARPQSTGPSRSERTSLLRDRRDRYQQERTRILSMVDSNQISPAEAAKLLDSVERETSTMACPFCEKDIRVEALKCHHSGQYLVEDDVRPKRLTRSNDRMLAGVCGGLAEYTGMDPTLIRILVVLITFFTAIITGLVVYLIAALIMPEPDA
jgi:phage shock protein C